MAASALILGAQESCQWVPGTGETRHVAGRVHIMEDLSLWKQSDPPCWSFPDLSHSPTVSWQLSLPGSTVRLHWLPTGTAAQRAQCFIFPPLRKKKSLSRPTGGQALSRDHRANSAAETTLSARPICPANRPKCHCRGQLGIPTGDTGPGPAKATYPSPLSRTGGRGWRVSELEAYKNLHAQRRSRKMTAQQLAGSRVPCEKACPEGNTAPSLQSTSFRLLTTIWSSPRAPGAYPTAQPLYCTCTGKTAPKGQLRVHPLHSRDGEGWAAVPVAHRSQLSHGYRHQAARKTVTSDVPERCRRVLGSVS